jgi:hypothetical protein
MSGNLHDRSRYGDIRVMAYHDAFHILPYATFERRLSSANARTGLATVQHAVERMTLERPHAKSSQTLWGQPHTCGTAGLHTPKRTSGCER